MAKVTVVFEDSGEEAISLLTKIEGEETPENGASPAMCMGMAVKALFETGILYEVAQKAVEGIADGVNPTDTVAEHFNRGKAEE